MRALVPGRYRNFRGVLTAGDLDGVLGVATAGGFNVLRTGDFCTVLGAFPPKDFLAVLFELGENTGGGRDFVATGSGIEGSMVESFVKKPDDLESDDESESLSSLVFLLVVAAAWPFFNSLVC